MSTHLVWIRNCRQNW